ncbi:hypothetical protein SAMN05443270_3102 [Lacrimispora sphenoides]|uniref:hypothetical protein n=1 Tax=Lacrimispora sphenoides TaxID=29370 RepID=UPI0008CA2899|nr:hypothetical protein [Lacrimispora sphenoides]SEU09532.1 hypothetical protein SAMN05443270_3102 [Lacrimispora sphenoides]
MKRENYDIKQGAKINTIKFEGLIALIKEINDSENVDVVHVINSLPTELGRNLARYILVKMRNMDRIGIL